MRNIYNLWHFGQKIWRYNKYKSIANYAFLLSGRGLECQQESFRWCHNGWVSNILIVVDTTSASATQNIGCLSIMTPSKMGKKKKNLTPPCIFISVLITKFRHWNPNLNNFKFFGQPYLSLWWWCIYDEVQLWKMLPQSCTFSSLFFYSFFKVQITPLKYFLLFRTYNNSSRILILFKDLHSKMINFDTIFGHRTKNRSNNLWNLNERNWQTLLLLNFYPFYITQHVSSFGSRFS